MDNTRTDISVYDLVSRPDAFQHRQSNAFKFMVFGLENLVDPKTGEPIPNASDILKQATFTGQVPSFSQAPIEIRVGNTVMKAAGTPTFADTTIQLHDYVGVDTYNVLYAWQTLQYNSKTGRVGLASEYKKDAYLLEYTTDFSKVTNLWKLHGVWIQRLSKDGYDNSQTASDVKISCQLTYDWAEPEDPNQI